MVRRRFRVNSLKAYLVRIGVNDTYRLLGSGDREWYFRLYNTKKNLQNALNELQLLEHLSLEGFLVPRVVLTRSGKAIESLDLPEGKRFFVLFEGIKGRKTTLNHSRSRHLGRLTARLHSVKHDFGSPSGHFRDASPQALMSFAIPIIDKYINHQVDIRLVWAEIKPLVWDLVNQLTEMTKALVVCHGDLTSDNVLVTERNDLALLDWDFCGLGPPEHDLSIFALMRNPLIDNVTSILNNNAVKGFLKGYNSLGRTLNLKREYLESIIEMGRMHYMAVLIDGMSYWGEEMLMQCNFKRLFQISTANIFKITMRERHMAKGLKRTSVATKKVYTSKQRVENA